MSDPDWPAIAAQLYLEVKLAVCRCEYSRTKSGVPTWQPIMVDGAQLGISRQMTGERCANCRAREAYEMAAGITL